MKVLLAFPLEDKQTGLYIKNAFEELDCEVQTVDAKVNPQDLFGAAESFQPDIVFCSRTPQLVEGVSQIRTNIPNAKVAAWNVDSRNDVREFEYIFPLANLCNIFYTKARGNVEQFQLYCPSTTVKDLQEGIDPAFHNKFDLTEEDNAYACDVLFAGDYQSVVHEGRMELLNHLLEQDFDFKIWGGDNYLLNEEHSRACQKAKIVLGHTGWPNVSMSMSARDYRTMGAGGFLLTNHVQDIETWLDVGKECETYKTKEECVEKIKYFLQHDFERKTIAEAGFKAVHEKHKFVDRIKQVLEDLCQ